MFLWPSSHSNNWQSNLAKVRIDWNRFVKNMKRITLGTIFISCFAIFFKPKLLLSYEYIIIFHFLVSDFIKINICINFWHFLNLVAVVLPPCSSWLCIHLGTMPWHNANLTFYCLEYIKCCFRVFHCWMIAKGLDKCRKLINVIHFVIFIFIICFCDIVLKKYAYNFELLYHGMHKCKNNTMTKQF